ncbi:uncharacterized protein LOC123563382 [Mercenaria mercenaria]|uniref:uncharacterized protein LOC123563382 n=1 Tax=Mercenaria mercenaria TaxID=6596 RepID=UPI00234F7088|nr:uncharacterized protein LOC123563382 [Mercenaria mercenaria]
MAVQRQSFVEHVTCPICLDLLYNPRALPCMHTFCAECLNSYITSDFKTGDDQGFECPVCKNFTKPPGKGIHPRLWAYNFPVNFALNGLVDEIKTRQKRNSGTKNDGNETKGARCTSHSNRVIEFECIDHSDSFCSVCAALFHRNCKQVNFLEYKGIQMTKLAPKDRNPNESSLGVSKKHKRVIRISKSFDDEETIPKSVDPQVLMNDFDRARSIDEIRNEDETLPKVIQEIHEQSIANTRTVLSRLCVKTPEDHEHQNAVLKKTTIPPKQLALSSQEIHTQTDAILPYVENNVEESPNPAISNLNDILEEDEDIISVVIDKDVSKSHVNVINEFYIRAQCDQKCCSVTGLCALTDGKLLLADNSNGNVKLFDSNGVCKAYVKLESEPWDVTAIEQYEAAVSCPTSACIHILLICDTMTITRTINLNKRCYGITYHNGEIYIAMENEIRIITYEGKLVQKIGSESIRKKLFTLPFSTPKAVFRSAKYISLNTDQQSVVILVSDSSKVCVTSMKRQGQVLSLLRFAEEDGVPFGVSAGRGGEFWVCQDPNKLIAINSDEHGNRIKTVLELDAIQAVHFNKLSKLVWVSRRSHNFITVYKVQKDSL